MSDDFVAKVTVRLVKNGKALLQVAHRNNVGAVVYHAIRASEEIRPSVLVRDTVNSILQGEAHELALRAARDAGDDAPEDTGYIEKKVKK